MSWQELVVRAATKVWEADWAGWGAWAAERGRTAYVLSSSFPRDCRAATVQTALVCTGYAPEYVATGVPGFAPIAMSWGWMAAGILTGVALTMWWKGVHFTIPAAMPAIAAMAPPLTQTEEAQLEVLRALHVGGRDVLHRKAADAGITETEFLYRLAGLPPPRPVRPPPLGGVGVAYTPY